jgi:pimeloyl-ACP methyl ester carboxylesterase
MGGSVASYYAGAFPERVHRLALLEAWAAEDTLPAPDRMLHWVTGWKKALEREPRGYASVEEAAERLRQNDVGLSVELSLRLAERGTEL